MQYKIYIFVDISSALMFVANLCNLKNRNFEISIIFSTF